MARRTTRILAKLVEHGPVPAVRATVCVGLFAILFSETPVALGQAFRTEQGHVTFTSSVPLHTFDGESDRLVGRINLADSTVDFYVDLSTLETGIGKRDKDMRKSLETDRFPFAEFFGRLVSPFDTTKVGPQTAIVRGDFTVHGVAKDVEIIGTIERTDGGLHVEASWIVQLKAHEIEPPSLLIMKVDDMQRVHIEAQLTRETEMPD